MKKAFLNSQFIQKGLLFLSRVIIFAADGREYNSTPFMKPLRIWQERRLRYAAARGCPAGVQLYRK